LPGGMVRQVIRGLCMMMRFGAAICGVAMVMFEMLPAGIDSNIAARNRYAAATFAGRKTADGAFKTANLTPGDRCADSGLNDVTHQIGNTIIGAASTYNPFRPGYKSGGLLTASGELYDPAAWTAAVQIDLREMFGGVHYGSKYRPTYALIETSDKQAIVKINDVGPLKPGRVVDLNEQTMRYLEPTRDRGVIPIVKVTALPFDDCTPGPIERSA
jgi:rare lipoprotein A